MSLIISGVVRSVRTEIGLAGFHKQSVVAGAKADAAILLVLQQLHSKQKALPKNAQIFPAEFNGDSLQVQVASLNGWIDLNRAPIGLMSDLYQFGADLDPEPAMALAQATLSKRQTKNSKNTAIGFDGVADLMAVPGMTYMVYAKVAPLVTTDIKSGSGRVNPLAAPVKVIKVLLSGNESRARQFVVERNTSPNLLDITLFKPENIEMSVSNSLSLQCEVVMPDNTAVRKEWRVYWGTDVRSGMPWRVLSNDLASAPVSL